jgi:hypothetical protein
MSPSVDPVAFVLGILGLWAGVACALAFAWFGLVEFYLWRARRRALRRRLGSIPVVAVERGGGWWAPVWEADWPEK